MQYILRAIGICQETSSWYFHPYFFYSQTPFLALRPVTYDFARFSVHIAAVMDDAPWLATNRAAMDPNAVDNDGLAPIHYAAAFGSTAAARVLLSMGARLDVRPELGGAWLSPVDVAHMGDAIVIGGCSGHILTVFESAMWQAEEENRDRVFAQLSDVASPFRVLAPDIRRLVASFARLPADAPVTRAMLCADMKH